MTAARGRGDRSVTLRRRRRLVASLAAVGCVVLGAVLAGAVAGPGVGHFRSAADRERYLAAYAEAMTALPAPSQVRDLPTSFGTVRVYRFDGAGEGAPILALPGTSSGVPVLADNLPGLLEHRDVYALDLLGEPGLSVQGTPVRSAAEQAA